MAGANAARNSDQEIQMLKKANKGDFPVEFEFKKGFAHSNLPDRGKLKEMLPFTRNPTPRHLTWEMTDNVINDFFWLKVPAPAKGQSIDAKIKENAIDVTTRNVKQFDVGLDSRLVAFDKPLRVRLNGDPHIVTAQPSLLTLCQTLLERGGPRIGVLTYRLHLDAAKTAAYAALRHYLCYRARRSHHPSMASSMM